MNSKVTGEGVADVKKNIAIFNYKQSLWSIDMKTKVAWYVPRMNIEHLMLDTFKDDLLPLEDDL